MNNKNKKVNIIIKKEKCVFILLLKRTEIKTSMWLRIEYL